MTGSDPLGGGDFPFGDLSKFFNAFSAGDPWQQAAQIAQAVAAEGSSEPNVDPKDRIAIQDLARVAVMYLAEVPGVMAMPAIRDTAPTINVVNRGGWTTASLAAYRPFFERFGEALGRDTPTGPVPGDPFAAMFGMMFAQMGPMMVAASAGAMIGHLGQQALGQYDLPVPRPGNEILIVSSALNDAAERWSVPIDELRMWLLVHELATHAVLSVPHVRNQLDALLIDFANAFRLDPAKLEEKFGGLDRLDDMSQLQSMAEEFGDPDAILSMMRTPTHDLLMPRLDALVAAVLGTVDLAVERVALTLIPSHSQIRQAMQDRHTAQTPADRFMERLLGLSITESTVNRGRAFVDGIIDRVGDSGLVRLWGDELDVPTAAEISAPGLWVARVGLDPDLPMDSIEIPDDLSGLDDL